MVFKLKCKNCGSIISYNTALKRDILQRCECGQLLATNIECKLDSVADMEKFELIGIEHSFEEKLLAEDLSRIEKIFDRADSTSKDIILTIIDHIYLLLNRDDVDALKGLEKLLYNLIFESNNGIQI